MPNTHLPVGFAHDHPTSTPLVVLNAALFEGAFEDVRAMIADHGGMEHVNQTLDIPTRPLLIKAASANPSRVDAVSLGITGSPCRGVAVLIGNQATVVGGFKPKVLSSTKSKQIAALVDKAVMLAYGCAWMRWDQAIEIHPSLGRMPAQ